MIEPSPLPMGEGFAALRRCAVRTGRLLRGRQIHEPRNNVGRTVAWADGTNSVIYRETVVDRRSAGSPTALAVCFRLRGVRSARAHSLFRSESELNTILFAGFPGFISKLWFAHDATGEYRGLYDWDGPALAEAYVRALWWALILVSVRSSIQHIVLPGVHRDDLLRDPHTADTAAPDAVTAWWRPVGPEA
jgi:hypothetical protein